jgi:hypothetical protein
VQSRLADLEAIVLREGGGTEEMIRAKTRVQNPDDVMITMEFTMPLKQWHELMRQMSDKWPSWPFSCVIAQSLGDINRVHYQEQEYKAP